MKILRFKKITLTNFMSIGSTPLVIDFENGLNLITGYNKDNPTNKNGIGKSTICDALFFALFGETIKKLKVGEIINDKIKKKCSVELEFSIDTGVKVTKYGVIRGIKPSRCELTINGKPDEALSTIPKTNEYIKRNLGIGKELFKQAIIMSVGKTKSFFDQGKPEKRGFVEGALNLSIFTDMLKDSRTGYNDSKKEMDSLSVQLTNEKARLTQYTEKDAVFEENKQEYIRLLKSQIDKQVLEIKELQKDIKTEEDSTELNDKLEKTTEKRDKLSEILRKVQNKRDTLLDERIELELYLEREQDSCPTCHREYDDVDDRKRVKEEKSDRLAEIVVETKDCRDKMSLCAGKGGEISDERQRISKSINDLTAIKTNNASIKRHINSIKASAMENKEKILAKMNDESDFSELIASSTKAVDDLRENHDELSSDNKIYDICKFVLSEEGVKSEIINKMKTMLNNKVNHYLARMGSENACIFDEYFVETIFNKYGLEKSYDAFSGGESKRFDLAILLAFQDILKDQSGIDIRLGFYDEILDTSLDEDGRESVLEILKDKSKDTAVYIISHRRKMSDLIDREIVLEKHNDFTYLKGIE